MRIRLERRLPAVKTDLGWQTVATQDLPILGIDGTMVSWAGAVELPTAIDPARPGDNSNWRVTVEEWERLPADPLPSGLPSTEARMVYADHLLSTSGPWSTLQAGKASLDSFWTPRPPG